MSAIPSPQDPVAPDSLAHQALYRKLNWRLLPFLLLCYTFAYLDRVNIGFAKLSMQSDLGISDAVYGLGAGIFFLGYVLFEIPSNLLLPRIGARKTISRIMVLWGLTSAGMMFVHDETTFYGMRFLLGVFEAGFAPGMIFYLTYWYGQRRMAGVMAVVMLAGPIGGAFGSPLSAWLMTGLSGAHGLAGWQWMFIVEGLPCVLLGALALKVLSDRPADAAWLTGDEKRLLAAELHAPGAGHHSFGQVLRDPRVYLLAFAYFTIICGIYAVSFWLPSILKADGVTDTMRIGLYSMIPYVCAAIAMIVIGRRSDRRGERRFHSAVPALIGAIALAVATTANGNLVVSLVGMTIATSMIWAAYTVFWAIPSQYLKGDAAAGGIALINTIGLIGGFLSPTIIGAIHSATGSMAAGLLVMVALLVAGAAVLVANRLPAPHDALATA
ncbi:TPA: MFS transporter [Burkholderia cepacia ATCC 25416]|uniref:MFS transporter n=1 Tax=Burkholderia cepacia TaxID=292 RepID=UPI001CF55378|nr:MFS transporter [Burkholderia cepacia]HDR9771686.1 MFS transporter [Burkholderia cepacia ATCC 25416]MCA8078570.1 MFS transporter [Burkholderia cepacia]HDR9777215.1 MFS transporter [Burkholderia cepacia ATCC 25416]HDR9785717.1 MFS transporter [Burkholderia cepacia ATCC 25416]HDR9793479.1 MFS transporter [Burkholderia cepacia ATCC 25416]